MYSSTITARNRHRHRPLPGGLLAVTLRARRAGRLGPVAGLLGGLAEQGLVGIAATNTPGVLAPFGGLEARLGNNPLAIAAPMPAGRPPFVLDMAFLGDRPPAPGDTHLEIEDHGFMFMKMHLGKIPTDPEARRRLLYGTNGKSPWEQGSGFRVESREPLGEGELTAGGAHVVYRATRGDVNMNGTRHRGITSILMI